MSLKTTLIGVDELAALPADEVLIVDCRADLAAPRNAVALYAQGHIPGAVFADLESDLSDPARDDAGLGRHPLPLETHFSALLSRWGWRPGLQVVAYDAAGGALAAARLWWLLRLCGVPAAVLDGGYQAWGAAAKPLETDVPARAASTVALHYDRSQYLLDYDASARDTLLLDGRAAPRYRGEVEPIDPVAGHVPGAVNRPFGDNLDGEGRFKPATVLHEEFAQVLGGRSPADVVHMCGSGVTACQNFLAMEHAGLHGARLYAPSWSGWVSDRSRPVEKG